MAIRLYTYARWNNTFLHILGIAVLVVGIAMLIPLGVSQVYGEDPLPFLVPFMISMCIGFPLSTLFGINPNMRSVDGVFLVTVSWWVVIGIGALPFIMCGFSAIDAIFEATSGFTTTGATAMPFIEGWPKALLLWRSLTQWLGGIAIVIIFISILPLFGFGGRSLFHNELQGSGSVKFSARVGDSVRIFGTVYLVLTGAMMLLLVLFGVDIYQSLCIVLATVSTGGFMPTNDSVAGFSLAVKVIITVFMILGGTNFYLHFKAMYHHDVKAYLGSSEFKLMIIWFLTAALVIWFITFGFGGNAVENFVDSLFSVASVGTSTGFAVADYSLWPVGAIIILEAAMLFGASSGSTAGGIKLSRVIVIYAFLAAYIKKFTHPRGVFDAKVDGESIPDAEVSSSICIVFLFIITIIVGMFGFLLFGMGTFDSLAISIAMVTNSGPGLGVFGPMGGFATLPELGKVFSCILMWVGRLEIATALVLFTRNFWEELLKGRPIGDDIRRKMRPMRRRM